MKPIDQQAELTWGRRLPLTLTMAEQVNQLCLYFSNDARFNGDLNKGFLIGKLGAGKTLLMAFFQQNQNASFSVVKGL